MKQLMIFLLLCVTFGCSNSNDADVRTTDIDTFIKQLKSAPWADVSNENFPEWLVVRINQIEIRPSSICKVQIYKGEWNKQTVYFILDNFSSCLCDFFSENGEKILDNLTSCRSTSKNWTLIYDYGEISLNLDDFLKIKML